MPNTLAHIGTQLPISAKLFKSIDPRWIAFGLLIPDLPWVLQRVALILFPQVPAIDLRAYVVMMSTPLFCIILSACIALLVKKHSTAVFCILVLQCLFHEILDAMQEKGGVGIPFLAPFQWSELSFPIFSMDGWVSITLTLLGAATIIWISFGKLNFPGLGITGMPNKWRLLIAFAFGAIYTTGPWLLSETTINANVHDLAVWRGDLPRKGQTVHFDRATYSINDNASEGYIQGSFHETPIRIKGIDSNEPGTVSCTATFTDDSTLITNDAVIHPEGRRFWYTIAGLLGVGFIWIYPVLRQSIYGPKTTR